MSFLIFRLNLFHKGNCVIALFYATIGVLGYLSQQNHDFLSHGNYFAHADQNVEGNSSMFFDGVRAVIAFSLLLTIPVDCLVASSACQRLMRRYQRSRR